MNAEASEYELIEAHPRTCVWELSLLCDLRCKHCGSYAGAKREDELTGDELRRVADQLIDIGCELVTLGGGEPTLHPLWAELGRRLTDGGVPGSGSRGMIWNFCWRSGNGFIMEFSGWRKNGGWIPISFTGIYS